MILLNVIKLIFFEAECYAETFPSCCNLVNDIYFLLFSIDTGVRKTAQLLQSGLVSYIEDYIPLMDSIYRYDFIIRIIAGDYRVVVVLV